VVLGARRSDRLAALADRIAGAGGEAAYAHTDVKQLGDLVALVKLACDQYGKLDVFINNAGIMPISPLDDLRVEDWEEMIDINIKGVLYGIAAALPIFRKQRFGHFVNIASTAGQDRTEPVGLFRYEVRGARHLRGFAPGGRQSTARDDHLAGLRPYRLCGSVTDPKMKALLEKSRDAFAIERPDNIDVNEIVIRPTALG